MARRSKNKNTEPLDVAIAYLGDKARTVREMEDKLDSLNYGEYEVYAAVERLKELGYLNDEKYAADFVETRLATKPVSKRKLYSQLYAHRVPKDIIEGALEEITEEVEKANALAVAKKFARQFEGFEPDEQRQRVVRRLMARGFDYDAAKYAIESVFGDALDIDFNADGCEEEED